MTDWIIQVVRDVPFVSLEAHQRELYEKVRQHQLRGAILFSEPHPTLTYGRSARAQDLLWTHGQLEKVGLARCAVSRGGSWTYHGPGQVLVYPIFRLEALGYHKMAARRFVYDLRDCIASCLKSLGVQAEMGERPFGLYVGGKKLASFGLAFHGGISTHGCALYLSDQSHFFSAIHPCGEKGGRTTSFEQCGVKATWDGVTSCLRSEMENYFQIKKSDSLALVKERP